jgi:hypothetical protein
MPTVGPYLITSIDLAQANTFSSDTEDDVEDVMAPELVQLLHVPFDGYTDQLCLIPR